MKFSSLLILPAVLCIVQVQAQNKENKDSVTLNRELTLEKEYSPSIRDASKINVLPELKEPAAPKAQVEYAKFSIPFDIAPQLTTLPAGSYLTDIPYSKKRGYLSAGISSFIDIDGDLGYQILNSDKDQLSVFGSHRSSNGNVTYLQDDQKQKMKINDNLFGLNFNHHFGNAKLFSGISYTYSSFNYYGDSIPVGYNDVYSMPLVYPEIDKETNQVDQIFDVNLGVTAQNKDAFNYLFKVGYSNFNQKYVLGLDQTGPKENALQLDMDLSRDWDAEKLLGLRASYKGSFYTLSNEGKYNYQPIGYESYSDISLNPYFFYDGGNWNVRLGLLADVLLNYNKDLSIAPDVELNYLPTEKVLVYLSAKGGVMNNNLKNTHYENRYIAPFERIEDSYSSLDALAGVKAALGNNFWLDVFAGYKNFENEHFYNQSFSVVAVAEGEHTVIGNNFSWPDYHDGQVFKVGGNLKYQLADVFELGLKAVYYNWDLKEVSLTGGEPYNPVALGKPDFTGDVTMGYKLPTVPLRFDLAYHLETGRHYAYNSLLQYVTFEGPDLWASTGADKMKNMNELSFKATYSFNDTFSVFGKANNLLFQKYDLLYGYPAQNFNIMGGISVRF